ncbi:DEAD/DEAH box helicase family protein [Olleya aquimaris]|uniref:Type I restriction enzyme R subunit n=1 Tax=Olleya aquimaris TaxID=639310 RepID=A0A327RQG8_9FLAO|nr:DEAD/DEAH box helicase family protein [Olleya aquimaris]RAJ17823.1 type I restriction enzyme R subunit [Olleya aquimaris]
MSNFEFLKQDFPQLYAEAKIAEQITFAVPKLAAVSCRSFLELGLNWLYDNDVEFTKPYDTKLVSLLFHYDFKSSIKPSLFHNLDLVRRFGNDGAHGNPVSQKKALIALKSIFSFGVYLVKYYGENLIETPVFREDNLPQGIGISFKNVKAEIDEKVKASKKQLKALKVEQEKSLALQKENELLKHQFQLQQAQLLERKEKRQKVVILEKDIPQLTPEQETRQLYIDELLKEAGWNNLKEGTDIEYPVVGMPLTTNPSGKGFVDYVLWGNNGLPLAVIEAKQSLHSASKGKHQAKLYADCLEQMTGQRPVIFYSNGFDTYIWDDTFYTERLIYGFYTKEELAYLIEQRKTRKDLSTFKVNLDIAGYKRPYQLEAIKRVGEALMVKTEKGLVGKNREALLVMATGSGKTRTAAAIVDMLTKCHWAKRILFLADRNALVTQAKNAFKELLPNLSAIDLTKEKEDTGTRVVFSTYPTILNKIDKVRSSEERFYGIGHFDVIIIDEAHRSVYQKYGAIFDYFDAILIGLTATPKKDIHHNTYGLFGIEDDNPTFVYELDQAVKDGHLNPPKGISVPLKFMQEGVKYNELSEKDKAKFEEKFGIPEPEEDDEALESLGISSSQMNSYLFNTKTVDMVLDYLFTNGLKVNGGDKLGKTIIFAKNHNHAEFIKERFNKNYPQFKGSFLEVIDNYASKAQDLLERFCDDKQEQDPQIAVSVDMMDTGVDAPRVVNLVFFKPVKSFAKYWQMIGRGTRLRPNLFGPGKDKTEFIIFDFCGNFEYFEEYPEGAKTSISKSISHLIYETMLHIVQVIRNKSEATKEQDEFANDLVNKLYKSIDALDEKRFEVKKVLRHVKHFKIKSNWDSISLTDETILCDNLFGLSSYSETDDEVAKRFDLIAYKLQLALLNDAKSQENFISIIYKVGVQLHKKRNIPAVSNKIGIINKIRDLSFWTNIDIETVEEVRAEIRDLVKFLEKESLEPVYTDFTDVLDHDKVKEKDILEGYTKLQSYKDRVESFIRKNKSHLVIDKLHKNIPITSKELELLEQFLINESLGTKEAYTNEYGELPLGKFVRSVVGLDLAVVNDLFADYIHKENLNPQQITFIQTLINFLNVNGTLDKSLLIKPPFTENHDEGIFGLFKDEGEVRQIISLIDIINNNAG